MKIAMPQQKSRSVFIVLAFLIVINVFALAVARTLSTPQLLEVIFFDIGQGDSILIKTPSRHKILIDGGPDNGVIEKLAKTMPFWDRTIDLVVLTHPDKDHVAGLIDVFKRYKVDNVLWTGVVRDTLEYKKWVGALEKEQSRIVISQSGQRIRLFSKGQSSERTVYFDILNPSDRLEGLEFDKSNDTAVVARMYFKDNSFLFTGDIGFSAEEKMVSSKIELNSDILKVGHHGSKYSTGDFFLEKVLPSMAVIQVGKNSYGHPAPETLERLEKFDIDTLRTDTDGDIEIISDGNNIQVKNENEKRKTIK